ncbi:MAG: hypothetical protein HOP02_07565 [Methylococcaceae bacterium]|nr:hypothetical protein [Methylococcaceae bacterium]
MLLTPGQLMKATRQRLNIIAAEIPVAEAQLDNLLALLPLRLPEENYVDWLKRGRKMAQVMPFPNMNFQYLTEVQRLAADSRDTEDALPEIALLSTNQQFRLSVELLPQNKLKLTLEALGLASSRYAKCLIGIAAADSKDQLISIMRLNADGDGVDESLDNSAAMRQALLRPVIALIEPADNLRVTGA